MMKKNPPWIPHWIYVILVGLITIFASLCTYISHLSAKAESISQPLAFHRVASTSPTGWIIDTIETDGKLGYTVSLALDTNDHPHLSYIFGNYPLKDEIRYAWYDGTTWNVEIVDTNYIIGPSSIKLYPIGELSWPRISYAGGDKTPNLMFAYRKISGWVIEVVEEYGNAWENSLAIKENDSACIAYLGPSNELKYAFQVTSSGNCGLGGNTWQCDVIDNSSRFGSISLALDQEGLPHISYQDTSNKKLKYARMLTSASGNCGPYNKWQCDIIDNDTEIGLGSSLILDENDKPMISYYDTLNLTLKLARLDTTTGNCGPSNSWNCSTIDDKAIGLRTSIANRLDPFYPPRIVYEYMEYVADLKLAGFQGDSGNCAPGLDWYCETLPFGGLKPALAIDSKGFSHLAYDNGDLMYARTGYLHFLPSVIYLQP